MTLRLPAASEATPWRPAPWRWAKREAETYGVTVKAARRPLA